MSNHAEKRDADEESDSSDDEDYVPEAEDRNQLSEEDSDAAVDDDAADSDNEDGAGRKRKSKGKSKGKSAKRAKTEDEEEDLEAKKISEEDTKKKAEDIWAAFKRDTDFLGAKPPAKTEPVAAASNGAAPKKSEEKEAAPPPKTKEEKPTIFEFAGETLVMSENSTLKPASQPTATASKSPFPVGGPRKSGGGLSGLMSQLKGKTTKLSTLEKTKMDWQNFKKNEGIDEEIQTFNRGKSGYLERQDFLERADHRQFEMEKQMRATVRKNNR